MVKQAARRPQRAVGRGDRACSVDHARPRRPTAAADVQGRRLMVRLKDGVTPVWPDFSSACGKRSSACRSRLERQIGNICGAERRRSRSRAETLAEMAQTHPGGRRGAIRRSGATRVPAFACPTIRCTRSSGRSTARVAGINVETAWTLQPSAPSVTVAVVDTGILPHPDLAGRVLPGYDFISDADRARDGNARDPESARRRRLERRRVRRSPAQLLPRPVRRRARSPPTPTTASASPASPATRRSFRCACSARAAARSRTSSRA